MKVFVTGASGFIGSHTVTALLDSGHEVMALATPGNNLWRLANVSSRIKIVRGTLDDAASYQKSLHEWQPEACIHLAWYAEPGKYLDSEENIRSLNGGLSLLRALSECNCKQIICAGTCFEYEVKSDFLSENDRTRPETLYATSKASFQMVGEQLAAKLGIRFVWGRIFYLYGTHEDTRRIIPAAILKLREGAEFPASPGEQVRDYLYVMDVANAFLTLMNSDAKGIYNICSREPVTIRHILETIGSLTGRPELILYGVLPYRNWEPIFICGNNARLKSLGWSPKYDLQSGLKQTISWWDQNQNCADR